MKRHAIRLGAIALLAAALALPAGPAAGQAQPIQIQETNFGGVVAEITEVKRKDGVLTIRVRYRNTGDKDASLTFGSGSDHDKFYVTAANRKYLVLRDEQKNSVASSTYTTSVKKGATYLWWAKYPAPPADQKKINFVTPFGPPFEDLPISD